MSHMEGFDPSVPITIPPPWLGKRRQMRAAGCEMGSRSMVYRTSVCRGGDYNLFGYFIRKTKNPNPSCGYRAVKGGGLPAYLVGKKQPES